MTTITAEQVDAIADVGEAMMLAITLDIPLDGLDSLDEIISRLRCHIRLQQEGSIKAKVVEY